MSDIKTIKSMKSKKVKISIRGTEFLIPSESIGYDTYNDNKPYIYMRAKVVASIIKQYVKKTYSDIVVSSTSDVYSGGSSVRVNVCNQDGSSVSPTIYDDIKKWEYMLKGGSFNGMIDMYESREDKPTTDNGTDMKYFPSYIFIENKPNWGTKHYWMNEWNKWIEITDLDYTPTDNEKVWIENVVQKYGGWLGYNKQFMSKTVLKNIDSIMGCI
jgi:hypothetical protein